MKIFILNLRKLFYLDFNSNDEKGEIVYCVCLKCRTYKFRNIHTEKNLMK